MNHKILFAIALSASAMLLQSCTDSKDKDRKTEMESPMMVEPNKDTMPMDDGMMQSMDMTMDKMDAMAMSGDFDLDFANMMVIHHQAAIEMSEIEIAKGNDAGVNSMAQNMINAQKTEINQFQQIINNYKPQAKKEHGEMHNELDETMRSMMDRIKNMKMTGNTDKDFVMMMIPHHEVAIAMSEAEMSHGNHLELKKMALKIISDQKKEIEELKTWQAQHN